MGEDAVVEGVEVGAELVEFELVALGDGVGEVFQLKVELGRGDFLAVELLAELVDLGAGLAEFLLGGRDGVDVFLTVA